MNAFNFELCFPYLGLTGTEYARKLIILVFSWSQSEESKKCDMRISSECTQDSKFWALGNMSMNLQIP
jgi:hypothetical protein